MDSQKKCKFCHKTFSREHIWMRHQMNQCPKKSKLPPPKPDFRLQIDNTEKLITHLGSNNSANEAKKLNKAMIMLKNSNPYYKFKCDICHEGFEFQSEKTLHQKNCFHKPKKNNHNNHNNDNNDNTDISSLQNTVKLMATDIQDLKDKIIEFRKDLEIIQQVKQQLLDLKEIAFHLRLFKMSSLKSST